MLWCRLMNYGSIVLDTIGALKPILMGDTKILLELGPSLPVYVALGQNGRVRITGGEDLVWFAKKSGLKELPVFFSYQRQV